MQKLIDGVQSALNPHSLEASVVAHLTWVLVIGSAVILILVIVLTAFALRSRPAWLARERSVVLGGIAFPVVVLSTLLGWSAIVSSSPEKAADLTIRVVGQQWWWRVQYLSPDGSTDFETANELRLPVGKRVELELESTDVLHSFWVPGLAGKRDLVPGRVNRLAFTPNAAAELRGQCAEYCGGPHGQMGLQVVTLPDADFSEWQQAQRRPAASGPRPFDALCATCHTVRGTSATGTLGPDLTHVASRLSIGAGVLPTSVDNFERWISQSQHLKPGNLMPSFREIPAQELNELARYLASLR